MLKEILFLLWLALPAMFANIAPIPLTKVPWLKKFDAPMDFGKSYRGKRIFGAHKTWRGLIAGVIAATFVLWLQQLAAGHFGWAASLTSQIDFVDLPTLIVGPLFAIGALGGDAIESFFKRQHGIPPGGGWFPWDQVDSVIGTAIVLLPFIVLTPLQYVLIVAMMPGVHVISTRIGYLIGLKERPI